MKKTAMLLTITALLLAGCATSKDQLYYEAAKAISKDNTMSQTACWSAINEIAKGGDNSAKVGAIALAEKCKNETIKIESPKRNWLGF
jgi:outer membrane lipoprotein SlyB